MVAITGFDLKYNKNEREDNIQKTNNAVIY